MARDYIPYPPEIAKNSWLSQEAKCPICRHLVKSWYCSNCGLPINNSSYYMLHNTSYHCGANHFRSGFGEIVNFQLCSKCYTPNPFDANYCRSCGENITTQARDKDGHGWVDLGLSVLWATERMANTYQWMSSADFYRNGSRLLEYEGNGKDAASEIWGHKWRTPTKDEFEELFTKCQWERCIDPISKNYALKAIGPNGNSIMIPFKSDRISLWTSTEYTADYDDQRAYAFVFINNIKIEKTLTAKQKKIIEFANSNAALFKVESSIDDILSSLFNKDPLYGLKKREKERRRIYPQYDKTIEQQKQILEAMGDDSLEILDNERKDKEKLDKLWLSTPVNLSFNKDHISDNKPTLMRKRFGLSILPVADKKWKGKL